MKFRLHTASLAAAILIIVMVVIMTRLAFVDSLTTDEKAHLPAGISYVAAKDGRLNPEHPPFMKLLAGLTVKAVLDPLVPLQDISFQGANHQLEFADALFSANPDQRRTITFVGRLPFIAVTALFSGLLYWWTARRYGERVALIALVMFGFSPTVLAHGHLVTFDVSAGFGLFVALATFGAWLYKPIWQRAVLAGVSLAVALLVKFSALALVPIFFVGFIGWILLHKETRSWKTVGSFAIVLLVAAIGVIGVYRYLTWNYNPSAGRAHFLELTKDYGQRPIINATASLIGNRITQPIGQYSAGAILTLRRSRYGSVSYFLGKVKTTGDHRYFPVLFLTKETIPTLLLYLVAAGFAVYGVLEKLAGRVTKNFDWQNWLLSNYTELLIFSTALLYALLAIRSPLNIGYRHILPAVLLLIPLAAKLLAALWQRAQRYGFGVYVTVMFIVLCLWNIGEVAAHPQELFNYYNEFVGGPARGYEIAVDSNYDWGQDLQRLADYADRHDIRTIALEYFGGDPPALYLGDRYQPWQSSYGQPEGWFGVSATIRQNAIGEHGADQPISTADGYEWLRGVEPAARVGSIFLYDFK